MLITNIVDTSNKIFGKIIGNIAIVPENTPLIIGVVASLRRLLTQLKLWSNIKDNGPAMKCNNILSGLFLSYLYLESFLIWLITFNTNKPTKCNVYSVLSNKFK